MTARTGFQGVGPSPSPLDLDGVQAQTFEETLERLSRSFAATADAHDKDASFPTENIEALREAGLLALTAPVALGGAGAGLKEALSVVQAVARGEAATALSLTMQYLFLASLAGARAGWPETVKTRVVRDAALHGSLINALRVEPDLGTPARGGLPATLARRTDAGWRLSGRKIYSTGSTALTWMLVWARTDEESPRVGSFLVHKDDPGRAVVETWDHLGLRASASHDVVFQDLLVPFERALGLTAPDAAPADPIMSSWGPVLLSGLYDAVARAARDWFADWAIERRPSNLGASLSSLPRFQEILGGIDGLLLQNRLLLRAGARGELAGAEILLLKELVTENAILAVEKAVAASGNPGLSRASPLQRHYRDVLCGRIHTPQGDMVLTAAGRAGFASRPPARAQGARQ